MNLIHCVSADRYNLISCWRFIFLWKFSERLEDFNVLTFHCRRAQAEAKHVVRVPPSVSASYLEARKPTAPADDDGAAGVAVPHSRCTAYVPSGPRARRDFRPPWWPRYHPLRVRAMVTPQHPRLWSWAGDCSTRRTAWWGRTDSLGATGFLLRVANLYRNLRRPLDRPFASPRETRPVVSPSERVRPVPRFFKYAHESLSLER